MKEYKLYLDESGNFKSDLKEEKSPECIVGGWLTESNLSAGDLKNIIVECWKKHIHDWNDCTTDEIFKRINHSVTNRQKYPDVLPDVLADLFEKLEKGNAKFCIFSNKDKARIKDSNKTYRYAVQFPERIVDLVDKLRCSANEKEKTNVYIEEANRIKEDLRIAFNRINNFDAKSIKLYSTKNNVDDQPMLPFEQVSKDIKGGDAAREKADAFCDMTYYLTQFLDGKEINVFLTTLHNLFENIASFLDVMHKQNISYDFTEQYVMF